MVKPICYTRICMVSLTQWRILTKVDFYFDLNLILIHSMQGRTATTSNEVTKWSHVRQKKLSVIGAYNDEHCWLNIWNLYIKNTDTINVLCIRLKIIWKYWQEQERSGRLLMCGSIFVLLITSPRHLSWLSDLR